MRPLEEGLKLQVHLYAFRPSLGVFCGTDNGAYGCLLAPLFARVAETMRKQNTVAVCI